MKAVPPTGVCKEIAAMSASLLSEVDVEDDVMSRSSQPSQYGRPVGSRQHYDRNYSNSSDTPLSFDSLVDFNSNDISSKQRQMEFCTNDNFFTEGYQRNGPSPVLAHSMSSPEFRKTDQPHYVSEVFSPSNLIEIILVCLSIFLYFL